MSDRNIYSEFEKEDESEFICFCFYKTRGQIVKAIKEQNLKTVEEVGAAVKAGTNCGSCKPRIQEILDKIHK